MGTHGRETVAGPVPPPAPPDGGLTPRAGDLGRLLGRGMRGVVKAARAEDVPELARLLHELLDTRNALTRVLIGGAEGGPAIT